MDAFWSLLIYGGGTFLTLVLLAPTLGMLISDYDNAQLARAKRRLKSVDPVEEIREKQRQYRREEMADWDKRFKELLPEETQIQRVNRQRRELMAPMDLRDMLEYNNSINAQANNKLRRSVDF